MMVSKVWILFVFCLAKCVTGQEEQSAMANMARFSCYTAAYQYDASFGQLYGTFGYLSQLFASFMYPGYANPVPSASVDAATLCPGNLISSSSQAAENVISHCPAHVPELCPERRQLDFSPDVLRAAAKFCENVQAEEYVQHLQTLAPCYVLLGLRRPHSSEADNTEARRIDGLVHDEWKAAEENSTVSCGFGCGRKCACRKVQTVVPMYTDMPNSHVREVCGQQVYDLVLNLQKRVLDALQCSEFGDYVKEFGWLKVNYQANKTA